MGIYDRDYYRPRPSGGWPNWLPQNAVGLLILINIAVYIAELISPEIHGPRIPKGEHWLSYFFADFPDTILHPWLWWKFLTSGFTHDPSSIGHILNNMLVLYFLGRDVEYRYGTKEFLRIYLTTLVFSAMGWGILSLLAGEDRLTPSYGASGAISGIVVLYALNFPRRTLYLFFAIPVPAWICGMLFVGMDMLGAFGGRPGENVAFTCHLSGAAFAAAYYYFRWDFSSLGGRFFARPFSAIADWWRRKPALRVHQPKDEQPPTEHQTKPGDDELAREVDRILEKVYRDGEGSLTSKERATLETASRKFRERK
jgi:membrane associated rhomboid family serine protease